MNNMLVKKLASAELIPNILFFVRLIYGVIRTVRLIFVRLI